MKIKMNNSTVKEISEAYKEFMTYNKAKNLSEATLYYYRKKLGRFTTWLVEVEMVETISEVSKETIQKYIIHLQTEYDLNDKSINTHLRAVKVFINYCSKFDYVDDFKVNLLKTQDKVKETYTNKELEVLLEKPNLKKVNFAEYRTWVAINWCLATGNRLGTMVNMKIKDLDFDNGLIHLNVTKNKNAQIIPMSRTLNKVLQEFLMYRKGEPKDYLFCNQYGNRLSKGGMVSAIKRYHKKRGVKYVNLFGIDLKEGFNKYNPLEQFNHYKETIKVK